MVNSKKSGTAPQTPMKKYAYIAVMGITGSGKTSLIKDATGYTTLVVGDSLRGCTQKAASFPLIIGDTEVHLIDTPGFDDTNRYDTDILEEVATFLATHYKLGGRLCGLIYCHPISETRMRGAARLNLDMFKDLCGIDSLRNVVLVSTMWDLVSQQVGEKREAEFASTREFWGYMVEHGARIGRHDRTRESALAIIRSLIENRPTTLHIQDELVHKGLNLEDTDCGRVLQREFAAQKAVLEKKLQDLEKQHEMSAASAAAKYNQLTSEMEKIETAGKRLKEDMEKKIVDRETDFRKRVEQLNSAMAQRDKDSEWWKRATFVTAGVGAVILTGGLALVAAAPAATAVATVAAPVGVMGTGAAFLGELGVAAAGLLTTVEGALLGAGAAAGAGATAVAGVAGLSAAEAALVTLPLLALL